MLRRHKERDAHNHSLRIQNLHFEIVFQSNTPTCSSRASLGVGLGVRGPVDAPGGCMLVVAEAEVEGNMADVAGR